MSASETVTLVLALVALGAVLLAGTAWARRAPADTLPVAVLRLLLRLYMRLYHNLRSSPSIPADPLPPEGPAIVVANHQSGVDPLAIAACTARPVQFLMAREYYEQRGLRWLFRSAGAIPVNRDGNDLGATKAALKALRDGKVIGIFPQAGIQPSATDDQIGGKSGAALLALKTGAPVVPAHISGTPAYDSVLRALLTPSRSRVRFGDPMGFSPPAGRKPTREEIDGVTRRILDRVIELRSAGEGAAAAAGREATRE